MDIERLQGLFDAARNGRRSGLARLLSVIERGGAPARTVGQLAFPFAGNGYTVGITGAPGAGKSTLTSALVTQMRADDLALAVLAIDPSSPFTGGAILGDRVRMQEHALDENVFIRSMATRGHLGGLALATPAAVRLLEATGREWVLIETVGVGQVEVDVVGAADTTIVVVNPGWGDAVQANKAGLMEIADIFVINKSDRAGADDTRRDLEYMLDLSGNGETREDDDPIHGFVGPHWRPPIVSTVASEPSGLDGLWAAIREHRSFLDRTGGLEERRAQRREEELERIVRERLDERVSALRATDAFSSLRSDVVARTVDPWDAAGRLLDEPLAEPGAS